MGYVLFAVGVAAALFALDQLALRAERRGWMYWRRSEGHRDAGGAVLGYIDSLFNPATRHLTEERGHKQSTRVDINVGSGAELDLESRTVYLRAAPAVGSETAAGR